MASSDRSTKDREAPLLGNLEAERDLESPSPISDAKKHSSARSRARILALVALASLLLAAQLVFSFSPAARERVLGSTQPPQCLQCSGGDAKEDGGGLGLGVPEGIQKMWASYAPWYPAGEYEPLPEGCQVTMVNILQRHGSRFPTKGRTNHILEALQKLQNVEYTDPKVAFLETYAYDLGVDALVPLGATESREAAADHYKRYGHLLSDGTLPFVRASDSERVVLSAKNWTAGFAMASQGKYRPRVDLIVDESLNTTLETSMCPASSSTAPSPFPEDVWFSRVFAGPAARLSSLTRPPANLTAEDAYNLVGLCALETVGSGAKSEFCALFGREEFEGYEYGGDLDKYYDTGYGNPLGRVQGVGYVNELLARLTGSPVADYTSTNRTLSASPATFPLDRGVYADFTHDGLLVAVYAALGLFRPAEDLDPTRMAAGRVWVVSRFGCFASRMAVEKVSCYASAAGGGLETEEEEEYVRILVNDAVQPLPFCANASASGSTSSRGPGLCTLAAFIESQNYAREGARADWERCWADDGSDVDQ